MSQDWYPASETADEESVPGAVATTFIRKGDYALFYSKGRGIIAVGKITSDVPAEIGDEKHQKVEMLVPEKFEGDTEALPSLPHQLKDYVEKRNYHG